MILKLLLLNIIFIQIFCFPQKFDTDSNQLYFQNPSEQKHFLLSSVIANRLNLRNSLTKSNWVKESDVSPEFLLKVNEENKGVSTVFPQILLGTFIGTLSGIATYAITKENKTEEYDGFIIDDALFYSVTAFAVTASTGVYLVGLFHPDDTSFLWTLAGGIAGELVGIGFTYASDFNLWPTVLILPIAGAIILNHSTRKDPNESNSFISFSSDQVKFSMPLPYTAKILKYMPDNFVIFNLLIVDIN